MERAFQRLQTRALPLGKHARKYLHTIETHGEEFLSCLAGAGRLDRVHTDRSAPSLADDFDHVAASGQSEEQKLRLLGCHYAVQFLHHNARSLERLALDLAEQPDRIESYGTFLHRVELEFQRLVAVYVRRVLRVVMGKLPLDSYVLCAVGTRGHQDDIDVVVIDDGSSNRAVVERGIARLSVQMLRYASTLDHYLTGWAGSEGYCISIDELQRALRSDRSEFVAVTELLRAERVAGSRELFLRLRDEVVAQYFSRSDRDDNTRHEVYVRGILGEIRSLLLQPPKPDSINSKIDGLRIAIGLTSALKVTEEIDASQPREVLAAVGERRPELVGELGRLETSLILLETFRHLGQILVAEADEIAVEGPEARENLERIAVAMGYRDRGPLHAADHLLVHYHESIETIHAAATTLMEHVSRHLSERSQFSRWTRRVRPESTPPDVARQFARALRNLKGVRFWDDILESLSARDGRLLRAFIDSFKALPDDPRRALASVYAEWGLEAPYTLLTLLTLIASRRDADGLVGEIVDGYLGRLPDLPENVRSLARVFRFYPDLMNRFLLLLDGPRLDRLRAGLKVPLDGAEVAAACERLRALVEVHRDTSRYVKRVLGRVTLRHPATVLALSDDRALRTLARGCLAEGERHPRPAEHMGLLGDFYDLEFLRIAMGTLRGASRPDTCRAFTELTETYLGGVFDACLRETEREEGRRLNERELPAIYLTGGYARDRAYDEDYDLIVLSESSSATSSRLAERAVARMNRQIARRGVMAQYRLGDRLGRYVTSLDDLAELLSSNEDDLFVDRCQLLGSRHVAGSARVEEALLDRVLRPLVFDECSSFTDRLARELHDRRRGYRRLGDGVVHLKEMPGGLREIDLALAAARACFAVREEAGQDPFEVLCARDPDGAAHYRVLKNTSDFLAHVRSVYRVTVAASDAVDRDHLERPAVTLGYPAGSTENPSEALFREIVRRTASAARSVEALLTRSVARA